MSEQDKQAAQDHAQRAGTQAKHAAQNTAKAAEHAASAGVDKAEEAADNVVNFGEKAAKRAARTSRRLDSQALAILTGDMGQGFIALSVSLWAATISFNKFNAAYAAKNNVIRSQVRSRPSS